MTYWNLSSARFTEVAYDASCDGDGVFVVPRKMVGHSTLRGVHLATAEGLLVHFFTCRGFHEGRTGEEDAPLLSYDDILVCHRWDIGATFTTHLSVSHSGMAARGRTCDRYAVDNGNLWNTQSRHLGHVVKYTTEVLLVWEDLDQCVSLLNPVCEGRTLTFA